MCWQRNSKSAKGLFIQKDSAISHPWDCFQSLENLSYCMKKTKYFPRFSLLELLRSSLVPVHPRWILRNTKEVGRLPLTLLNAILATVKKTFRKSRSSLQAIINLNMQCQVVISTYKNIPLCWVSANIVSVRMNEMIRQPRLSLGLLVSSSHRYIINHALVIKVERDCRQAYLI